MDTRLILRAEDVEDLSVISATFQDLLVRGRDVSYDPKSRLFALVGNRFMWERKPKGWLSKTYYRTRAGLHFSHVLDAKVQGLLLRRPDTIFSLLAIQGGPIPTDDPDSPEYVVKLIFSGDTAVRLHLEVMDAEARDLGEPWETSQKPEHPAQM